MFKMKRATPATNHMFDTQGAAQQLCKKDANIFYPHTMQLMYLSKRSRLYIQLPVSFLTTCVKKPESNDWKNLGKLCGYLRENFNLPLTLQANSLSILKWYVDASLAFHSDMRIHTYGMLAMSKGCIYGTSIRQRLNTKISTESELVGASNLLHQIVWNMKFLEAQGYYIKENTLLQENRHVMHLDTNGRASNGKCTCHINIR